MRVTRRSFLHAGAVLVGGSVVALGAACAPQSPSAPAAAPTQAPAAASTQAPAAASTQAPAVAATQAPAVTATQAPAAAPTQAPAAGATQAPAAASTSKSAGQVVFSQRNGTQALDPSLTGSVSDIARNNQCYDTLVDAAGPGVYQPRLALSWSNPDPNTWEFKLRQGVKFHNGEPFNANSVKVTLDRWADPAVKAPMGALLYPKGSLKGTTVVDDYTVRVMSETPFGGILGSLNITPMMPADATKTATTNPIEQVIGTGAYKVTEWVKGDHVTMVANPEYWAGPPKIQTLIFKDLDEDATRMAALMAGEVDILDEISSDQAAQLKKDGRFSIVTKTTVESLYPVFNVTRPPFDNVKVRQAMNYGIDMKSIVQQLLGDAATPQVAPVSPVVFGFNDKLPPYAFDPEKAKSLLQDAGVTGPLTIDYIVPGDRYAKGNDIAQAVAAMAANIGITLNVHNPDMTTGFGMLADHSKWHMFQWGIAAMTSDADMPLRWFFYTNRSAGTASGTTYSNPQVDQLLDQAVTTLDQNQRKDLYGQAEQILWTECPCLWQSHTVNVFGVSSRVSGFQPLADMREDLRHLEIVA